MIQLKLCLTGRKRNTSIPFFRMDLILNKNFIGVINIGIGVSNSSQKSSGDFLELSRKSDSSVIDELLKLDLLVCPGFCAPFSAYLTNRVCRATEAPRSSACACSPNILVSHEICWICWTDKLQNTWAVEAESFQWAVRAGQGNRIQTCNRSECQCLTLHNVTWGRDTLSSICVFQKCLLQRVPHFN